MKTINIAKFLLFVALIGCVLGKNHKTHNKKTNQGGDIFQPAQPTQCM